MAAKHGGSFYEGEAGAAYLRHRHAGVQSPNTVMEEPAFLDAVGDVNGTRVLDLGCGDGSTAGLMMKAGAASYLGIDGSTAMVERARAGQVSAANVRFEQGDIESVHSPDESFDLVVSRMALHYVEDVGVVLDGVHRMLGTGGRLVFSVVHPVITSHDNDSNGQRTSWTVDGYFARGPRERPWFGDTAVWHHRTIEDHVRLVLASGFRLDALSECEPVPARFEGDASELARRRRVPLMLLLAATKLDR